MILMLFQMQPPAQAQAAPQRQLMPFRWGTRRRMIPVGQQAFSAGSTVSFRLDQVGYLQNLWVFVRGTNNVGASSALSNLGPFNLINRFKLFLNLGSTEIINVSGYGAWLYASLLEQGSLFNKAGIGDTTPHTDIYQAGVASGDNTWNLAYKIPVSLNDGDDCDVGLINLQAPEVRCTFDVICGANSDPVTVAGTGFTGTIYLYADYYEIPPLGLVRQPPKVVVRLLEDQQPITATGENIYTVPRMGNLLQLLHVIRCNGSRSDAIDFFQFKINKTDTFDRRDRWLMRLMQRHYNPVEFPTGAYMWDFFHAQQKMTAGDLRDAIDTEKFATLEALVNITTGTTLGSGNNFLQSIRRIVQTIAK